MVLIHVPAIELSLYCCTINMYHCLLLLLLFFISNTCCLFRTTCLFTQHTACVAVVCVGVIQIVLPIMLFM